MQKILIMETLGTGLRSEAIGWSFEDGDLVEVAYQLLLDTEFKQRIYGRDALDNKIEWISSANHMLVGCIGSPNFPYYPTPLHAIGDDWKLLAPPTEYKEELISWHEHPKWTGAREMSCATWWFVRD